MMLRYPTTAKKKKSLSVASRKVVDCWKGGFRIVVKSQL